jgi:predicted esterase
MSNESGCHSDISELLAPPKPELACPTLQAGKNQVQSQGGRDFLLVLPNDYDANEVLPVVFLWHWLGGSADSFRNRADVQTAVDHYRLIAVIPEAKGDTLFKWPIEASQSQARIDEELQFFDHMLSCVSGQYKVNAQCISSVGVSAGALFTQVLASGRGQYLSSFVSLSGGSGGLIQPWKGSQNKMPAMVLWGGPKDNCLGLMDFNQCSKTLEQGLGDDGHFFVECVHNCGHAAPPFEPPGAATAFAPMWEFILDHPAWLPSGSSPYSMDGMPQVMPEWCGIGAGSATPRSGECSDKSEC